MNKWVKKTILPFMLLFLLPFLPLQTLAAGDSVMAQISFTVENAPGTVVMEAVTPGAPMPEQVEFENVTEETFRITFTEAGDYLYKVYQRPGSQPGVYDTDTVYEVGISVIFDSNGELAYVMSISKSGSTSKVENIVFNNVPTYAYLDIKKVAKSDGKEIEDVVSGKEFLYEITVENHGEATATNVVITDTLPTELPLLIMGTIHNGGQLSDDRTFITWDVGDIPSGESKTVSFTVFVPQVQSETSWVNRAVATYGGGFVIGGGSSTTTTTETAAAAAVVKAPASEPGENSTSGTTGTSSTPGDNNPETPGDGPQTGDNSHVVIWFILMIASYIGLVIFFLAEKKMRDKSV